MLTAIQAEKGTIVNYINRLIAYDALETAKITIEHGLYEEALSIYCKNDQNVLTKDILIKHIVNIDRSLSCEAVLLNGFVSKMQSVKSRH